MTQRNYSMTLPMGTLAEISIPGPSLIAAANNLYKNNTSVGWGHEDCLTMCAITSINGEQVTDLNAVISLDIKEYLILKTVVTNLVEPSAQQLQASIDTLVLLNPNSVGSTDGATSLM